jgi:hypothetical protein
MTPPPLPTREETWAVIGTFTSLADALAYTTSSAFSPSRMAIGYVGHLSVVYVKH